MEVQGQKLYWKSNIVIAIVHCTMTLDREFVERIEYPENSVLQDLFSDAQQTTRDRLSKWGYSEVDDWLVRKMSYTYYYDHTTDDPDYVFLLQDPGGLQQRHTEELEAIQELPDEFSRRKLVSLYRQFAKSWLLRRNEDFSERFFTALDDLGLISIEPSVEAYLRDGRFFDDFYMTDVVKYRTDGFGKHHENASVDSFLREELRTIDPDLIFAFGGSAWSAVQEHLGAQPVTDDYVNTSKITESHGHLCESTQILETHVLPLSHLSGQIWWRFPPDEYIARLRDGIQTWQEIA